MGIVRQPSPDVNARFFVFITPVFMTRHLSLAPNDKAHAGIRGYAQLPRDAGAARQPCYMDLSCKSSKTGIESENTARVTRNIPTAVTAMHTDTLRGQHQANGTAVPTYPGLRRQYPPALKTGFRTPDQDMAQI